MTDFLEETSLHPDTPLPDLDDPTMHPFWEGCRAGRLLVQRDPSSGAYHWPPKPRSFAGGRLEWVEASGRGRVFSYVVAHEPFLPAFYHLLPLVLVLVELDEGPRLVGYMVGCTPDEVDFGMPVRVRFKRLGERVVLPVWERAG